MAKKYCKYTKEELQEYCNDESYCVKCVESTMHIGLPPWGLKKFNETVRSIVSAEKLNRFDSKLNGIVLDIQSIKVVGEQYAVRNDSSTLHVSLNVKFYVFQPRIGAMLVGIVKHVALHHFSVTIHRFFNVTVPMNMKNCALKTNMSVIVMLTKFDLDDSIPYFEGKLEEILWQDQKENSMDSGVSTTDSTKIQVKSEKAQVKPEKIQVKREQIKNGRTDSESDSGSGSDFSEPIVKREIKQTSEPIVKQETKRNSNNNRTVAKVKQEPVSSSNSSSSDSESSDGTENQLNSKLQINLKTERQSESSSDESDAPPVVAKTKQPKKTTGETLSHGKRKHESGSSIIGKSLLKMNDIRNENYDSRSAQSSSSSSSSSEDDVSPKKKMKNNSFADSSFASPGLSSTRLTTKKTTSKTNSSGTNAFLQKMMSRFDK